ncbi:MAG: leucine-rich repeat domain-containing protein [Candidatus Methanomethylophilaceae archaeon]|nr:leucine-rich repeat domain-containing protein [Candidatus Methanomethylophilaceae archaeon]
MRRLFVLFLALLFVPLAISGSSDATETDSDGTTYEYVTHGSGHPDYYCEIAGVKTSSEVLHLPSVLEGYDVHTILSGALDGCGSTVVIVPGNLEEIQSGAFAGCSATDVYLMGDTVVGGGALDGFRVHAVRTDGQWSSAERIEVVSQGGVDYALLPDGATAIGGVPVDGRLEIAGYVDGFAVTSVGDYAFAGEMQADGTVERRSDIGKVVLPEGLVSIGQRAFYYNDLSEVSVPGSLEYVRDEAFRACTHLGGFLFTENLAYIGFEAFRDCHSLTAVDIPGSVERLCDGAFYICQGITTLRVDTDLPARAFGYCTSLVDVTLGDGVEGIGSGAFYRCELLRSVEIPGGVSEIGAESFRDCVSLSHVDLGQTESIGRAAFRGCLSLTEIDIPETVSSMGGYSFADCMKLRDVYAYGKAPGGGDTVFLNDTATVHCRPADLDSWSSSAFGLEVVGDIGSGTSLFLYLGLILVAVAGAFVALYIVRNRKDRT